MDIRRAPRPDNFDITSGRSCGSFLDEFEDYCYGTFKGSSSMWSSELKEFLNGTVLKAYQAFHIPGESYNCIKTKLLDWCSEYKDSVSGKLRKQFERAKMLPGEALRLYAARLERDFSLAFPAKRAGSSQTLQRKFLDTAPRSFRKHVFSVRSVLKMQGLSLDWSNILSLSGAYDAENAETDTPGESDIEPAEVWASSSPAGRTFYNDSPVPDFDSSMSKSTDPQKPIQVFEPRMCNYCHKRGHLRSDCWRFNGKCLACGSSKHQ